MKFDRLCKLVLNEMARKAATLTPVPDFQGELNPIEMKVIGLLRDTPSMSAREVGEALYPLSKTPQQKINPIIRGLLAKGALTQGERVHTASPMRTAAMDTMQAMKAAKEPTQDIRAAILDTLKENPTLKRGDLFKIMAKKLGLRNATDDVMVALADLTAAKNISKNPDGTYTVVSTDLTAAPTDEGPIKTDPRVDSMVMHLLGAVDKPLSKNEIDISVERGLESKNIPAADAAQKVADSLKSFIKTGEVEQVGKNKFALKKAGPAGEVESGYTGTLKKRFKPGEEVEGVYIPKSDVDHSNDPFMEN